MFLTTYFKETPEGQYKADIHESNTGYIVEYYKPSGEKFRTEDFSAQNIHYVKNVVESWMDGIKPLNG